MADMSTHTTTSKDGTVITYDRTGDGSAVILVHPAFGHRMGNPEFAGLAQLLSSSGYSVYNYDRRGRGDSGDNPPYAVQREIEDLAAVISAAGGSAAVYGMSSGAALALWAANQGLPITSLALFEAPFIVDDSRPPMPASVRSELESLCAAGRRGDAVALFMTNVGTPAEMVAQFRTQPWFAGLEAVAHTLAYDVAILEGTQLGRPLSPSLTEHVTQPALVIVSSKAIPWMRNSQQALVELLADARLVELEGEFHALKPEVLAPAIAEFFAEQSRPRLGDEGSTRSVVRSDLEAGPPRTDARAG
jgi:pimeloyl-ACP methyl ester carboxylesterase